MASKCKIRFSTAAVYGSAGGDQTNSKASRAPRPHAATATSWQVRPHVIHKFTYIRARTSYTRRVAIMYSPPCCRWSPCRVIAFRSRTSRSRRAVERPYAIRSRSNGCVAPEPDKASPQQRNTPIPIPIPPPHPPWPESPWPPRQAGSALPAVSAARRARRGHRRARSAQI